MQDADAKQLRLLGWALHAAGLVPTAAIIALVWFAYIVPTGTAKQAIHGEIERVSKQLFMGAAVRATHRELKQQLDANRDKVALVRKRMPDRAEEDNFLRLIADASKNSGLEIKEYSRGKEYHGPDFSELDVNIRAHGSYASICRFLDYLQQIPRVAKIVSLQLKGQNSGDYPLDMTVRLYYGVRMSESETKGGQNG